MDSQPALNTSPRPAIPPLDITAAGDRYYLRTGARRIIVAEVLDRKSYRAATIAHALAAAPDLLAVCEAIWAWRWSPEGYDALTISAVPWLDDLDAALAKARTGGASYGT